MVYNSIAESIGHEIKAIDHLMQRKMIMTASKSGLDKVTVMHGWIIGYLILNLDRDIYQKDIESEFAISCFVLKYLAPPLSLFFHPLKIILSTLLGVEDKTVVVSVFPNSVISLL